MRAGADVNAKGYKVLRGVGVLQGDGIQYEALRAILRAVTDAGYSAAVRVAALPQRHGSLNTRNKSPSCVAWAAA